MWLNSASSVPAISLPAWLEQGVDYTNTLPDVTFTVRYVPERQDGDAAAAAAAAADDDDDDNPSVRLFI
jgi:hypothetical protein